MPDTDVFTYSVRDASGAVNIATLTVDLNTGTSARLFTVNSLFAETTTDDGTTASGSIYGDSTVTYSGALSITNEAGETIASSSSSSRGITLVVVEYGTLSISSDSQFTYALNTAFNAQQITHKEVFSYSLEAADGTVTTNSFTIDLHPNLIGTSGADSLTSSAHAPLTTGAGADTLVYHLLLTARMRWAVTGMTAGPISPSPTATRLTSAVCWWAGATAAATSITS
nr:Ig-like domain repeat protein [Candidatus Pantoea persica]